MNEIDAIKKIISLISNQQYEEALILSRKSRDLYEDTIDFYFLEGECLLKQYKKVSAIEIFQNCIKRGEGEVKYLKGVGSTKAYKHIGDIYYDEGDYDRALRFYKLGLKSNTRDLSFVKKIAKSLKYSSPNNNRLKEELEKFFKLELQSNLVFLAEILMELGVIEEAYEYIEKAIKLEKNFLASACLQRYYFYKRNYVESMEIYEALDETKIDYKAKKYYLLSLIMENEDEEVKKEVANDEELVIYSALVDINKGYGINYAKEKYGFLNEKYLDKVIDILNDLLLSSEINTFNKVINILELIDGKRKLSKLANILCEREIYDKAKLAIFAAIETMDQLALDEIVLLNKILLK